MNKKKNNSNNPVEVLVNEFSMGLDQIIKHSTKGLMKIFSVLMSKLFKKNNDNSEYIKIRSGKK